MRNYINISTEAVRAYSINRSATQPTPDRATVLMALLSQMLAQFVQRRMHVTELVWVKQTPTLTILITESR